MYLSTDGGVADIRTIPSPGRFYAAALAKVIVAQIIRNYDLRLVDPQKPRWFTWRTSRVPREDTMMVFTPRAE